MASSSNQWRSIARVDLAGYLATPMAFVGCVNGTSRWFSTTGTGIVGRDRLPEL